LAKAVICLLAALTLLQNLGVNITALLGSVSVLGLALGLAAQDTVANLFGAVAVFMDRPFKVGDRTKVGAEVDGTVEEMGLRATRVRTVEGFLVTVPNKTVGNNTVTNIAARPTLRFNHAVGITYDTPAARVRLAIQLLEEIYRAHPFTHDVLVRFDKFGDFFLNLNILWWSTEKDWAKASAALQELNLVTKERFDAAGIEFAFPTSTIHLRQDG
ncbi:MAG: mechanosensitive ion channel family protein, partial [Verrucomicrobiota bacterium]